MPARFALLMLEILDVSARVLDNTSLSDMAATRGDLRALTYDI